MENKKVLNRIILFFSALIIITFSVFYKNLIAITVINNWFKVLYYFTIYLSIACTGVGLVISLACGFKDEYDIIWFVQFLNLCSFLLTSITALVFAINLSTTITLPYFFFCLEYFLLNATNLVFQTIKNFKFFKKDMKSVFSNGEPDKSYRYGLENDDNKEKVSTKELKSKKYDLLQDDENELESDENDDELADEDIENNNESSTESVSEENSEELKEDIENNITTIEDNLEAFDKSKDESKNEELANEEFDNNIVFNPNEKNASLDDFTYIKEDDIIRDEPQKEKSNSTDEKISEYLSNNENLIGNSTSIEDIDNESEAIIEDTNSSNEEIVETSDNIEETDLSKENNVKNNKKAEAKLKEKETKASKISALNKFISR